MKKVLCLAVAVGLLSGCVAVPKQWQPAGGSKADGVVKVAYEVLDVEVAETSEQQALEAATQSCKAWGYIGAQPFGLESKTCNIYYGKPGSSSCKSWVVSKPYQCVSEPSRD